jgi:hypothetical protein
MCHNRARNRGSFKGCDATSGEVLKTKIYTFTEKSERTVLPTLYTHNTLNLGGFRR